MRRGLTAAQVEAALGNLDTAALPRAAIAALRLADRLSDDRPHIDAAFYAELRQALDEDEILELGAALSIASGWQRFIEAFGIRPDVWTATTPLPWSKGGEDMHAGL
jgi:alkylhydroperoxidase family enzyme